MAVPIWRSHTANGSPVFLVDLVVSWINDSVFSKDLLNDADDESTVSDFDSLMLGAFQGDWRFGDAWRGDFERGGGS